MRALHHTHSVQTVLVKRNRSHIGRVTCKDSFKRKKDMNATPALSRWVSLATLGVVAALLFILAFGPQPSLYAG